MMREFSLFCAILVLAALKVNAQVDKGNFSLGIATTLTPSGDDSIFGIGYSVNDGQRETLQLNLAPRFGYVIRKDLNVGLDLIISYFNTPDRTNTFIAAGPFARYYFKGKFFKPYAELQASYGNFHIKSEDPFFGNQDFNVRYLLGGTALG